MNELQWVGIVPTAVLRHQAISVVVPGFRPVSLAETAMNFVPVPASIVALLFQ